IGEVELGVDLVVELVSGAADALAEGVTALDHEVVDDAVEDDAVVEGTLGLLARRRVGPLLGALCETHEVVDGLGGVVAEEVYLDVTHRGVEGSYVCMHCLSISSLPRHWAPVR